MKHGVKGGTLYKRPCSVSRVAYSTYRKSEVFSF